ncbi:MAG: SIS domain-containing protein [Candidatus Cloacimonetes bacterium]|nr:SIS domain-containing protein [Candidatus Cloacimonadota bacterium]
MTRKLIQASLTEALKGLQTFLAEPENLNKLEAFDQMLAQCFQSGKKAIAFGNGGSMCDAMHFAEEFTGRFRQNRKALPAIAISDPTHITCVANDFGFEQIFARGVEAYASEGDLVLGISTSGNSPNVLAGLKKARALGCKTVALLGGDGGEISGICDLEITVPGATSDRIQELHTLILHITIEAVESLLFPQTP